VTHVRGVIAAATGYQQYSSKLASLPFSKRVTKSSMQRGLIDDVQVRAQIQRPGSAHSTCPVMDLSWAARLTR
jgi:hypothetical protein